MKTQNVLQKQIRVSLAAPCFMAAAAPVCARACAFMRVCVCACVSAVRGSANNDCPTTVQGSTKKTPVFTASLPSSSSLLFLLSPLLLFLQRALGVSLELLRICVPSRCLGPANCHLKKITLFIYFFFCSCWEIWEDL